MTEEMVTLKRSELDLILERLKMLENGGSLTPTEAELTAFRCMWDGLKEREIVSKLNISAGAYRQRLKNLYRRIGVNTNITAARWLLERGYLTVERKDAGGAR